jgi:hypothetical protein
MFGGVGVACEAPLAATSVVGSGRGGVPRLSPRLTRHWSRQGQPETLGLRECA